MTNREYMEELKNLTKAKELKQEAEEKCVCVDEAMRIMYGIGYIDGAEPREKRIADLEKENHLLGERCNQLLKDKGNLTDELAKWKEEWQEQVQKAIDEGYARTQQTIQLTKAKEIIRWFVVYEKGEGIITNYNIFLEQAEQFLKEIEK